MTMKHSIFAYISIFVVFVNANNGNNINGFNSQQSLRPQSNTVNNNPRQANGWKPGKEMTQSNIYQNVQMLQPFNRFDTNSVGSGSNSTTPALVTMQLQLTNYVDAGLKLPGGMTCVCPSGFSCNYLGTTVASCFMSFTFILSSSDASVKYMSTQFVPLTSSGTIDFNSMTQQQKNNWNQPYTFQLTSKPSAIDVFVHHMGVVINSQTGELAQMQSVVHVDTFILPLNQVIPTIGANSQATQTLTLTGVILQTQLTLAYSIQCVSKLIGPNCDLNCNASTSNSGSAVCASNTTGFFYTCDYTGSGQVLNCLACPWGIAGGSSCQQSPNGGLGNALIAGMVPSGFRVATIVLGLLVGILIIFLLVVTIYSCVLVNRRIQEEGRAPAPDPPGHNYRTTVRADGSANRPLLQFQATYVAVPNGASAHTPVAFPRSVPSMDATPSKSSLRKTNQVPAAHLGGGSSLNDTLNTTLSSVPLPPSKEADV